jgi:transposase
MKEKLRFLGMDVHAETIAVAIAEPDGEVRSLGTISNRMESLIVSSRNHDRLWVMY